MKTTRFLLLFLLLSELCFALNFKDIPDSSLPQLPKNFRWCVSTSAYQVEGGLQNSDWWHWEQTPGRVKNNETSGLASDHWNRIEEDVDLLLDLKVTDYRMSIEWSRLEPQPGKWDQEAIQHYRKEIELLLEKGIQPMVTLHHFTFPQWVREKGAWEWDGLNDAFKKYTEVVFTQIAPDVENWITINEPNVQLMQGYVLGIWPPSEHRKPRDMIPLVRSVLKLHAQTYHQLKSLAQQKGRTVRVGLAHALGTVDAYREWNLLDRVVAHQSELVWNWLIPDAVQTGKLKVSLWPYAYVNEEIPGLKNTQDFFGVNYYTGQLIHVHLNGVETLPRPGGTKSDMGWEIYPEGLYRNLKMITKRYSKVPIIITENGIADAKDSLRAQFLWDHIQAVQKAINEGAPVEGYCHWSFMDNFEWADGFGPRFGLIEVDYKTHKRTPRPSAELFRRLSPINRK